MEDVSEKADGAPELDKRMRVMARQALEAEKPVCERRHIVVGGARKLYDISELPVAAEESMQERESVEGEASCEMVKAPEA